MSKGVMALWFGAAFFLQGAAGSLLTVRGIGPDLILCCFLWTAAVAEHTGIPVILATGTAFLYDICFSSVIGAVTLPMLVTGIVLAIGMDRWNGCGICWTVLLTAAATVLENLLIWGFGTVAGSPYKFLFVLQWMTVPVLYHIGLMALLHRWSRGREKGGY